MGDTQECLLLDSGNVEGIKARQQLGTAAWGVQGEHEGNGLVQLGKERGKERSYQCFQKADGSYKEGGGA